MQPEHQIHDMHSLARRTSQATVSHGMDIEHPILGERKRGDNFFSALHIIKMHRIYDSKGKIMS